jgi:glutamine synthetase
MLSLEHGLAHASEFACDHCGQLESERAERRMVMKLGAPFVDAYAKIKEHEWHEHNTQISAWERAATIDC